MSGDGLEAAGALATAGLAAAAVEGQGGRGPAEPLVPLHGPAHAVCRNCGTALSGSYCSACGQSAHVHRSLLHLGEEILHGVFHFDAKGWRTLPLLVLRPGLLTRRYVDGQRVRYVSPLALFLFTIFLLFFVASLTGGPPTRLVGGAGARAELEADLAKASAERDAAELALAEAQRSGGDVAAPAAALAKAEEHLADGRVALAAVQWAEDVAAAPASGAAVAASVASAALHRPGVQVRIDRGTTGLASVDAAIAHAIANPELTLYKLKNSAYKYSFMLVPISLPFLWLLFAFRRDVSMYDHAVFVLYSLSFMSLLFVVLVGIGALGLDLLVLALALGVPPVHMALQLRDAYGLGLGATLWRTAALVAMAGLVFALFVVFIGYVALG